MITWTSGNMSNLKKYEKWRIVWNFLFFFGFLCKKKVSFSSLIKDITICIILTSHSLSLSLYLVSVCLSVSLTFFSLFLSLKRKKQHYFICLPDRFQEVTRSRPVWFMEWCLQKTLPIRRWPARSPTLRSFLWMGRLSIRGGSTSSPLLNPRFFR